MTAALFIVGPPAAGKTAIARELLGTSAKACAHRAMLDVLESLEQAAIRRRHASWNPVSA